MNILAVCQTFMQVIAVIQLKKKNCINGKYSIVITKSVPNSVEMVKRLKKCGIFEEVVLFYLKNDYLSSKKLKIQNYMSIYHYLAGIGELINYDFDILLGGNIYGIMELYFNRIKNHKLKVYLIQDGTYNYMNSEIQKLVFSGFKTKFKHNILKQLMGQYIFAPECGYNMKDKFQSIGIPNITKDELDLLNYIFNYHDSSCYDKKVYFLDQAFEELNVQVGEQEYIKQLISVYGFDNVVIKLHPRTYKNKYLNFPCDVIKDEVPLEVILLNNKKIKKLVSMASSAGIMPALCMGNNIESIFLYQLKENEFRKYLNYDDFCLMMNKISNYCANIHIAKDVNAFCKLLN